MKKRERKKEEKKERKKEKYTSMILKGFQCFKCNEEMKGEPSVMVVDTCEQITSIA